VRVAAGSAERQRIVEVGEGVGLVGVGEGVVPVEAAEGAVLVEAVLEAEVADRWGQALPA